VIAEADVVRDELERACVDAGLAASAFVVWIVAATRPDGATPIAYLHPAGRVTRQTVQVFRAVGAARTEAYAGSAHRLALWRRLPGLPEAALGPMLRHELVHAARWERSGTAFYEADERLRARVDGHAYASLPTEREANAAAAAYARARADGAELAALPELAGLFAAAPPADVVGETLGLLGEGVALEPARLAPRDGGLVVSVVAPAAGSGGMV
jgi:hypothetical protein